MAKKYYAVERDPEWFDWDCYYGEDLAEQDRFWAGGNRDFCEINASLRDDVAKHLEDLHYDLDTVEYDKDNESFESNEEYKQEKKDLVCNYFSHDDNTPLSEDEIEQLIELSKRYWNGTSREEDDIVCDVLGIIYKEPFKNGVLTGCSQGDWIHYICPESMTDQYLDYIEAVFFGTGTEFSITCDAYEEEPNFSEVDTYCDYTALWKTDDIKKWLADVIDCTPDEVVIMKIKDTYTTKHYNYEYC